MSQSDPAPVSCDLEPVHTPGRVQSFGALIAARAADDVIAWASANVERFLGRAPADLLGSTLAELLGREQLGRLKQRNLQAGAPDTIRPWPCAIAAEDRTRRFDCLAHVHDGLTVLEFLPQVDFDLAVEDAERFRRRLLAELRRPATLQELCAVLAPLYRLFAGYDRVMVYRFHPDWHGEVVAEETDREERFLGLHFPATDVPAPVRRAYLLCPLRLIADIAEPPVPLLSAGEPQAPLDLTYAKLRAVAPTHVQYLRNMGVRAAMSVSLIVNGRLWGLIACHHDSPRLLPAAQFQLCEVIAQMAAGFVERLQYAARLRKLTDAQTLAEALEDAAARGETLRATLAANAGRLQAIVPHDSLALRLAGTTHWQGAVPTPAPALERLADRTERGVLLTDRLAEHLDLTPAQRELWAGGAYLSLSESGDHLFLGRRNWRHVVAWGGRQDATGETAPDGVRHLTPRRSFALWQEQVDGVSRPFDDDDLEILRLLRRTLSSLRAAERERAARQAQRAAEQGEAELRVQLLQTARVASMNELASAFAHEINQPLTAMINYVAACHELVRQLEATLSPDIAELMEQALEQAERAGEIVRRVRGLVERGEIERGELDLSATVAEAVRLALPVGAADKVEVRYRLDPGLPPVLADRIQIQQVVFNLVRNALEAMAATSEPILTVGTGPGADETVEAWVRDNGPGIPATQMSDLFRPLASAKPGGMGIGLSLCRSIVEAHGGEIHARNIGPGAEFRFRLPIVAVGE